MQGALLQRTAQPLPAAASNHTEKPSTATSARPPDSNTSPNTTLDTAQLQMQPTPSPATSQHNLLSQSQSQIHYSASDPEPAPITYIHHSAREQPTTCPIPTFSFDWRAHGIDFVPPPSTPNPNILQARTNNIQHNDHDCLIVVDGSFQGTRGAADYRHAGTAFLIHAFQSRQTYIGGRFLPTSDGENSAPVAEAEATLSALTFACSLRMKRPLIVHDNLDMTNFLSGLSSNTKQSAGGRYSRIKDNIKRATSYLDTASCSHVKSHTDDRLRLTENDVVDKLAVFFRKNPGFIMEPRILDTPLHDKLLSLFPNASDTPTISCPRLDRQNGIRCIKCGSPGHEHHTCFLLKYSSAPRKCVFTRI
jgi:hypothetical protein